MTRIFYLCLFLYQVYHQKLQHQQQLQQQYQQRQLQLQQQEQRYRQQQEQDRLMYGTSPKLSPSSHAARDYDIKRKLSNKQRERRDDNKPKVQPSLTGSPGTVKQRVKERKHTMKDAEVIAKLRTICTESDPSLVYKNMKKIGQG